MPKLFCSIFLLCFYTANCSAQGTTASQNIKLTYKAYWGGFVISEIQSTAQIDDKGYQVDVSYEVTGLASIFSKAKNKSSARGLFSADGTLKPLAYESAGTWSKNSYHNRVRFRPEDSKIISHDQDFKFKEDVKYIPIRDELKYGPDLISFYLGLMFTGEPLTQWTEVQHRNVFGGFFLFDIAYRCPNIKVMKSNRSSYRGEAVVCEFSDKIIDGGFERIKKKPKKKKPKSKKDKKPEPVAIWFARAGKLDATIPVYSEFSIGWGKVRIYLSDIEELDGNGMQKAP